MPSFSQNITAFIRKTNLRADVVVRKLAFDAFRGVLLKSPVDTGRFRASWRIGINVTDKTVEKVRTHTKTTEGKRLRGPSPDKKEATSPIQPSETAQEAKISQAVFGGYINISNNLPYGPPLENGHSKQAPKGMLNLTFLEIRNALAAAVRKATEEVP